MSNNMTRGLIEILEITKGVTMNYESTKGDVVYRSRAGNLNITCRFVGRISDDAAKSFARVFHDALDRVEKETHQRLAS